MYKHLKLDKSEQKSKNSNGKLLRVSLKQQRTSSFTSSNSLTPETSQPSLDSDTGDTDSEPQHFDIVIPLQNDNSNQNQDFNLNDYTYKII